MFEIERKFTLVMILIVPRAGALYHTLTCCQLSGRICKPAVEDGIWQPVFGLPAYRRSASTPLYRAGILLQGISKSLN